MAADDGQTPPARPKASRPGMPDRPRGRERHAARGSTVAQAQRRAYAAVDAIDWPEGFCRRDIGWRAILDGRRS